MLFDSHAAEAIEAAVSRHEDRVQLGKSNRFVSEKFLGFHHYVHFVSHQDPAKHRGLKATFGLEFRTSEGRDIYTLDAIEEIEDPFGDPPNRNSVISEAVGLILDANRDWKEQMVNLAWEYNTANEEAISLYDDRHIGQSEAWHDAIHKRTQIAMQILAHCATVKP